MKTNYISSIVILVLLLILCNIFINIDKKIVEGVDPGTLCNTLIDSSSVTFTDLPNDITQYDNSLSSVTSYEITISDYVDFSNNIKNLIDNSINIISDNNLFCNLSDAILPLYLKCSSTQCYNQMQQNNNYSNSIDKTLSISSRTNTFTTIMRGQLMYFKSILTNNMTKIGLAYKNNIDNYIAKHLKSFKDDLDEINNSTNNNIFLLNTLKTNSVLKSYTESFVNQNEIENLYIRTNMLKKTCGNPCKSIVDSTNLSEEQIQNAINSPINYYTCDDCNALLENPVNVDNKITPYITKINTSIQDFNNKSLELINNINNIKNQITPYINDLKNLIQIFKQQVVACSNTLKILSNNELSELELINTTKQLTEWNRKQITSNLPPLNFTTYSNSDNINTNINNLVTTIRSRYTKLESFLSTIENDMFGVFFVLFEEQIKKIDNYINSLECGLNNLLAYEQQNEPDSNFSLLDSFTDTLLVPKIFTIFDKSPGVNLFGNIDAGKIFSSLANSGS